MRIRGGYHHVHLTSPDPAAAASWYVRFLGAEIVSDADLRGARNVRLKAGEGPPHILTPRPRGRHPPAPANAHYGFNHICLAVDDLDEALRDAEAKRAVIAEPLFTLSSGRG